jgi:hypothetical protein
VVEVEATFPALWFERVLSACGHDLWVGDTARIRASKVRQQRMGELGAAGKCPRKSARQPGDVIDALAAYAMMVIENHEPNTTAVAFNLPFKGGMA